MRDQALDLLKRLSEAHGTSSCEDAVRRLFAAELDESLSTDKLGNVFCTLTGSSDAPRLMIEAHMDEVGFAVRLITAEGFLRFTTLGGWWGHTLLAQRVRILTRSGDEVLGVITSKPPHFLSKAEREKVIEPGEMFIDIGASSADEVQAWGIRIGDPIVPASDFTHLRNDQLIVGKAFDNRVGMALVIQALQQLRQAEHPNTIIGVGSVQEEVGTRGAQTAASASQPDVALIMEATPADDAPGSPSAESQGRLGKGPQIRLMDPSAIMNRGLAQWAIDVAEELEIPHQIAVRTSGGTDARPIHLANDGIPCVVIGVPARYIHTPNSIIDLDDYLQTLRLVTELGKRLDAERCASFTRFLP